MVKCLGICFSLCCALCSPPQRTHGGSNTAVTTKRESNPHVTKKEIKSKVQSLLTKHFIAFFFSPWTCCKLLGQTSSSTPTILVPTLNSSLKSLPSSAERIRYSSSSESRGIGKYLLEGEGDLGRRTTVCSPVFKGIYGGQTAYVPQQRTLQALTAPAKTSLMTIKISYLCDCMSEMISWVINLPHKTILAQDLALPLIYFTLEERLYVAPYVLWNLRDSSNLSTFHEVFLVHKEYTFTSQIKKWIKRKRQHYIFMLWWVFWVQHKSTLFLQEAIWNLFIHRCNKSFLVVFEPATITK